MCGVSAVVHVGEGNRRGQELVSQVTTVLEVTQSREVAMKLLVPLVRYDLVTWLSCISLITSLSLSLSLSPMFL